MHNGWCFGEEAGRETQPCKRQSEVRLRLVSVFKFYAHKCKLPASGTTGDGRVVLNPPLIQQHRVLSWAINSVHERFKTVWNLFKRPWQRFNCRTFCIKSHADMKKGQQWLKRERFKPLNETFERGSCMYQKKIFPISIIHVRFSECLVLINTRETGLMKCCIFLSSLCFAVPPLSSH